MASQEIFQIHNWLKAIFWLAVGFVFLAAVNPKKIQTFPVFFKQISDQENRDQYGSK